MSAVHKKRLSYLKSKGKLIAPEKKELEQLEKYLGKKEVPAPVEKVVSEAKPKAEVEPKKEDKKK